MKDEEEPVLSSVWELSLVHANGQHIRWMKARCRQPREPTQQKSLGILDFRESEPRKWNNTLEKCFVEWL